MHTALTHIINKTKGNIEMADLWYAPGSYLRVPVDLQQAIAAAAEAGDGCVPFELGCATSDGGLQRFVLRFDAAGGRRLASVTHEAYALS